MIKITNLGFHYQPQEEILKQINLDIQEGECISIIGKNGSGKSTLGRLIAGITKPSTGKIEIDDMDTKKKANFLEIRKKIGIVFQNPENQILFGKVKEDILFALKNLKLDNLEQRIQKALTKVGMQGFENQDTYELSLGQKQRITIAGALAVDTKYIVLDEPTTMLDPVGKDTIYQLIAKLKQQGYTIIYITNVMDEILLSDRVIIMEQGQIVDNFAKKELLSHIKEIQESGIKIPTIVNMVLALQQQGIALEVQDWTQEEVIREITRVCKQ